MSTSWHRISAALVRRTRLGAGLMMGAILLVTSAVSAQAPDVEDPWELGRDAYRNEDFDQAARYIIEAIQRDPENPQFYLGLARTDYWRGNFERAVYYYDIYLTDLADRVEPNVRSADRLANVRDERNSANAERTDSEGPVSAPAGASAAREAFETRLTDGPILTTTGGGALAMYRGMLRAGYAHPDLVQVRVRLSNALLNEANDVLGDHDTALPVLTLGQWQTQRERYDAWVALNPPQEEEPAAAGDIPPSALDPSVLANLDPSVRVSAHLALCEGQLQYLNENYPQAAAAFGDAMQRLPDLLTAHMGRLNALLRLGNAAGSAEAEITELERALRSHAPGQVGIANVYRAAFASQRGDHATAGALLSTLLGVPPSPVSE